MIDTLIADTLELMAILDQTEEFGGCYLWKGYLTKGGNLPSNGRQSMRRIVWEANNGPIPPKMLVTVRCKNSKCLACLRLTTKREVLGKTQKNPVANRNWRASIARTVRATQSKITMEIAREIRASDKTCKTLAAQFGVNFTMISKIRNNRAWVEHQGNPFAGLMA